jgi:predicted phage baseplate assembly protein
VTRLTVDTDENFSEFGLAPNDPFRDVRNTVVLHSSERLAVAERITPIPIEGSTIDIVEDVSTLVSGWQILFFGPTEPGGASQGEVAVVREVLADGHALSLESPLQASYVRAETTIFANVVVATHGETVADEILGNGDAAVSFQSFELKQSPLTYVQQAGAPDGAASTLELRINGVRWHEVPTFYGRGGDEAIFTSEITDDQTTIVRLGDGVTGARASTGRNNVTATYRKGIGSAGNLPGGVIKTPLERPKGLTGAHNPLPASGGTDPELPDLIRQSAPNTVRTFGRIVSLRDFEATAREFAGVAKARAFLDWDEESRLVKLIVAGEQGAEIVNPQFQMLVDDLDSRRDPNRTLRVLNFCPVDLQLWLTIYPHADYLLETVETNVRGVLDAFFAFDRLALGQSIALSEIHYVLHQAPGVVGVQVNRLRALPATTPCAAARSFAFRLSGPLVQQVVAVAPYELARLDTTAPDQFQIQWGEPT